MKGEWFALTEADMRGFRTAFVDASKPAMRALGREIVRDGRRRLDIDAAQRQHAYEKELAYQRVRAAIPVDELVLDRLQAAAEAGETLGATCLARRIKERKAQDVHEAIRCMLVDGRIAMIEPARNPATGAIWLDAYRQCDLKITDATCDWEQTLGGYEVMVSEPPGEFVWEFFSSRPYRK